MLLVELGGSSAYFHDQKYDKITVVNSFENKNIIRGAYFGQSLQKLVLNLLRGSPETPKNFYEFSVDQYESCLSLFSLGGDNILVNSQLLPTWI